MGSIKRKFGNNITSGKFDATDLTGTIPASNVANASLTSVTALPGISGDFIQTVASDPPAPDFGDVWYNSTEQKIKLKGQSIPAGSWSSGANMNIARWQSGNMGISNTSSLAAGGYDGTFYANTETYNGSAWTEVNDMNTLRRAMGSTGTQTAGIVFGGINASTPYPGSALVEQWDGTNWTEVGDLGSARYVIAGMGTSTAALAVGGYYPITNAVESWNGTSWTSVSGMGVGRRGPYGSGTSTDAIAAGGNSIPTEYNTLTESWNGSSWSEVSDLNTGRDLHASTGSGGTSTSLLVFGNRGYATSNELWNGSSWTELNDLATARDLHMGSGSASSGLCFGGRIAPGVTAATEEWDAATPFQSIQGS